VAETFLVKRFVQLSPCKGFACLNLFATEEILSPKCLLDTLLAPEVLATQNVASKSFGGRNFGGDMFRPPKLLPCRSLGGCNFARQGIPPTKLLLVRVSPTVTVVAASVDRPPELLPWKGFGGRNFGGQRIPPPQLMESFSTFQRQELWWHQLSAAESFAMYGVRRR